LHAGQGVELVLQGNASIEVTMQLQLRRSATSPPTFAKNLIASASVILERRWAAVLVADVVEYTRLMGLDEDRTHWLYRSHRSEVIDPKVIQHGARFCKSTGDGILVEFRSALDALKCAIEVQQEMAVRTRQTTGDFRVVFRIGLNCGDIMADDEDIYGDEVNMAARLQEIAPPGGIAMSSAVIELVRGSLPLPIDDIGVHQLRNMQRVVHVYRCSAFGGPKIPVALQEFDAELMGSA
jgi:adenylate cyclase